MEYAKKVRTDISLDSIDSLLTKIRVELESDQRPEVLDELLEMIANESMFIRVNLLGTFDLPAGF